MALLHDKNNKLHETILLSYTKQLELSRSNSNIFKQGCGSRFEMDPDFVDQDSV
jgi:hypothetical protein